MVFGESALKDFYRWLVWGPYRQMMEWGPVCSEVYCNRSLGKLAASVMPLERQRLEETLRLALGDSVDVSTIARECFATHFANQYVGFGFAKLGLKQLDRYLSFEGFEKVEQALSRGKGAVLAHPHMGLPQLALHGMGLLGHSVHQVGGGRTAISLSRAGERSARVRAGLEERLCAQMHDGQRFLRPVLRALKANELVFTACDGTGGGIEIGRRSTVTVLGQLYAMPVFPVWLCLQADAALIPMCCRTDDSNPLRQIVTFEEPIYPTTQEVMMGALADHLSLCLRDYPGDWHFWDQWRHSSGGLLVEGELNAT